MRHRIPLALLLGCAALVAATPKRFTLEQIMSAPFPTELTAAPKTGAIAWVLDERGARNIWVAEPPDYKGRRLTGYREDDGQEIAQLSWTRDGRSIIFVRGGDFENHGSDPNPASLPQGVEQDIWIVPVAGGMPRKIAQGNEPVVSSAGDRILFLRRGEIWSAGLEENAKPEQLIHAKGQAGELRLAPDGGALAFVTNRNDHAFIAVYNFVKKTLVYLDPSVDRDSNPVWSPDARQIAFIRTAANTSRIFGPVPRAAQPWSIHVADAASGQGRELWRASEGPGSAFHAMVADNQLFWGAQDRIVFPWERTGWMHLYSMSTHGDVPTPLNTNGDYEIEHAALSSDGRTVLFSSNQNDIDRRHLWRVSVSGQDLVPVTRGEGIEWSPAATSDGKAIAMLRSDARNPARAAIKIGSADVRDMAPDSIPADFPASSLVVPQQVILSAADGLRIHGQLFMPPDAAASEKRPAVVFFHGGSRREMLLGWHYMDYYHNAYAMNQYLASLGFIVLSVNYRSGIGYGLDFREAPNYGLAGASEFNDVLGAGLYLRSRPDVDPKRIGLWGGSYGGYLTALGLARASDLFSVGVDFHGVHDWASERNIDPARDAAAARLAFESSPLASVSTWRSPVLLIHGDDDRNVAFHQTVMLVEALRKQKVEFEELIFPDEIHGFLTEKRWLDAYHAAADFLGKHLH
ncbi:MAG TPA: prolyl oligopeptidase family serine peptidase [Bryobacteraceae bacterium]|nr:prolyl oligopeptidase family serine peptidase [Bryobacteraceae bacterium]